LQPLDTLISQLPSLRGHFTEPDIVYGLIADDRGIGEIASADTLAIHKLVACLGDTRRSRVTLAGERVCDAARSRTACVVGLVRAARARMGPMNP
jgi:hypothetical protein